MAAEEPVLNAEVDIRSNFSPFNFPTLTEVIQAIEKQLPEDRLKVVKQLRGPLLGLYRLTSTDYTRYEGKTLTIRGITIPIILRRKQARAETEKRGTLVTIYDAYEGRAQGIPGSEFNAVLATIEGVSFIRQTTPQFHKGTRILNGNRYVILDFDPEKVDLGEYIQIENFKFKLNYYGQQRYCYLCQAKHGSVCPEKEVFKQLMAEREGKISHKIYSDSTLRKANQLALAADIACTSGAGIGQIANLIAQDPDPISDIIIVAGANEMRHTDDQKQFQFQMTAAAKKLHDLSATRKIKLVLPTVPRQSIGDEVKYAVMKETMESLKSIDVIDLPQGLVEYEDIHPTQDGTAALVGLIQKSEELQLVLNYDHVTTHRNYLQVHSYYKVGCRTCDNKAYTTSMCADCYEASKATDTTRLVEIYKEIYEKDNPPLAVDYDMQDILKRGITVVAEPNDDAENDGEAAKKQRLGDV